MRLQNFHDELFQRLTSKMENEDDVDFLEGHQQKMEAEGMRYAKHMFWGAIGLALLLILLFNVLGVEAQTLFPMRPRYTLTNPNAVFVFTNHDTLPFQIIEPMCWDDHASRFCDEALWTTSYSQAWIITDWNPDNPKLGAIYQNGDSCYWWMYQPTYGVDGQPHIDEHYWISCP
jgi:hypothetical protein